MRILNQDIRISRPLGAVAAGTTLQTSAAIDMQADGGYDGVLLIFHFGALTATQVTSIKAQYSDDDSSYADIAGSASVALADADSGKCLVLDIYQPASRYIKALISRGTANAVIDGITAIQYRGKKRPSTHLSTHVKSSEVLVAPIAGTA